VFNVEFSLYSRHGQLSWSDLLSAVSQEVWSRGVVERRSVVSGCLVIVYM